MNILVTVLKYSFVGALGIECVIIARAIALLAWEKARPARINAPRVEDIEGEEQS